jgi:peptide/nickel transport system permease protein
MRWKWIVKVKSSLILKILRFGIILKHNPSLGIGLVTYAFLLILGFGISFLAPYDPLLWSTVPRDLPPSLAHPFGTTSVGQDIFWLLTYALKNSIIVGCVASLTSLFIGTLLGLVAGYKGGFVDKVSLFFSDTITLLPLLPMLIFISSMLKGYLNVFSLGLLIASFSWGYPLRAVRSIVLSLREREFTYTAMFSGMGSLKIAIFEYLPHALPWISASFVGKTLNAIAMEVTLAVFGLTTMREATLGKTIYWAMNWQAIIRGIWWWLAFPVIILIILFVSLYLLSTGISEQLDPRGIGERI